MPRIATAQEGERWGATIASAGNRVGIAAPDRSNPGGNESGAVSVYGATSCFDPLKPVGMLFSPLPANEQRGNFGSSLTVSADGGVWAISEPKRSSRGGGIVHLYQNLDPMTLPALKQSIEAPLGHLEDLFGRHVAIVRGLGLLLLVGAPNLHWQNPAGGEETSAILVYSLGDFTTPPSLRMILSAPEVIGHSFATAPLPDGGVRVLAGTENPPIASSTRVYFFDVPAELVK